MLVLRLTSFTDLLSMIIWTLFPFSILLFFSALIFTFVPLFPTLEMFKVEAKAIILSPLFFLILSSQYYNFGCIFQNPHVMNMLKLIEIFKFCIS